ncbi:hypothetical protein tb265_08450 [Gemmatimonadetes bacterium T265]|nr:hypothetical protein tb265_08450 [Gemmatimonadetes bacterium T265]
MEGAVTARRLGRRVLGRWARDERGTAIVEFAIIFPVLLTMLLAIIDFGRMMAVAASLAAAVRDGARQGAVATDLTDATQISAVKSRVISGFQPFGGAALTTGNIAVNVVTGSDGSNYNVNVKVTGYTYVPITPVARMIGMGTVTLTRQATFRWERTS